MGQPLHGDPSHMDESQGGFAMFDARARSSRGAEDPLWRVGFARSHRDGQDNLIVEHIWSTYERFFAADPQSPGVVLDVGGGSGPLCDAWSSLCRTMGWRHIVVDGEAMLAHLEPHPSRSTITGSFPSVLRNGALRGIRPNLVVVYSVLQYVLRDMPLASFLGGVVDCMAPGTAALIGDLPNRSKRRRHLSSSGELTAQLGATTAVDIGDSTVASMLDFVRSRELDAFVLPQPRSLRTWRHREDVWIYRPDDAPYLEEWE